MLIPFQLHARLGELELITASSGSEGAETTHVLLTDAVRRFSRSVELCDDYLRGYYGLKLVNNPARHLCRKLRQTDIPS